MFDSDEPESRSCSVCLNNVPDDLPMIDGHLACPYCRSSEAEVDSGRPMKELGSFVNLRRVESWPSDSVVYSAYREDRQFLISILSLNNRLYDSVRRVMESGYVDPYQTQDIPEHEHLIRSYPFELVGGVVVGVVDFYEGESLVSWLLKLGKIEFEDAVSILISCITMTQAILENSPMRNPIQLSTIFVSLSGQWKVKAVHNVAFHAFEMSPHAANRREMRRLRRLGVQSFIDEKEVKKLSLGRYTPPELDANALRQGALENKMERHAVYSLGALLYEMLLFQAIPRLRDAGDLVQDLVLKPIHEVRQDIPERLSEIVARMTAFNPESRYQTLSEALAQLNQLGMKRERLEFVQRSSSTGEKESLQNDKGWIRREEACDFRKVKWGMSPEEVRRLELTSPKWTSTDSTMYWFQFQEHRMMLTYSFVELEEDGPLVLYSASIQASGRNGIGFAINEFAEPELGGLEKVEEMGDQLSELIKRGNVSDLNSKIQDIVAESKAKRKKIMSGNPLDRQVSRSRLSRRKLDRQSLESAYEQLKNWLTEDFGPPSVVDARGEMESTTLDALIEHNDPELPDDFSDCLHCQWECESTQLSLEISPIPYRDRMVMARLESKEFGGLMKAKAKRLTDKMKRRAGEE